MEKIHLIGNAHIDPVWLWEWQEGLAEIKATFRSALDRMNEFPDYLFTSACGAYYMWIEEVDPDMFREIKARIEEGRWCITGGWLIQPDCNLPCGESFARHTLITQRYFKEKFGRTARVGYNVDSFGHAWTLPMILREGGMDSYVFMRPESSEKKLPCDLFIWESPDGSRVTTYRVACRYNITEPFFGNFKNIADLPAPSVGMAFYGIGNHGGGPTAALLSKMKNELDGRFVYSTPERYFAEVSALDMPTIKEDLQYHARGCYSALDEIKHNNRRTESALLTAERFALLADKTVGFSLEKAELDRAWRDLLFCQFHDILGGCSIPEAYGSARNAHGEALAISARHTNAALSRITGDIDALGGLPNGAISEEDAEKLGYPFAVFNPHAHPVRASVKVRLFCGAYRGVSDAEGHPIPCQIVRDTKTDCGYDKHATLFEAELPPYGYALYRMHKEERPTPSDSPFTVGDALLENADISLRFDEKCGELISIFDKESGKELLSAPTSLRFASSRGQDTWAHGVAHFSDEYTLPVSGSARLIESGPVRATVRVEQSFGDSHLIRDYSISPRGKRVRVATKIDFREKFCIMKLAFPVTNAGERAVCGIPYGHITRPTDGSEQVMCDWVSHGDLLLAAEGKYSFDAKESLLSLTVLRSVIYADHFGKRDEFCEFTEQGEHRFSYEIGVFEGAADAQRRASELLTPPTVLYAGFHGGRLPTRFSALPALPKNIALTACKHGEDGEGMLIRLNECEGQSTEASIELFGHRVTVKVGAYGIASYLITEAECKRVDLCEWPVEQAVR